MKFKKYLEEAKNTHMIHIEDMVIDGGVNGTRSAINALRDLRNMLAGHTNDTKQVTVKWDGAPAVFVGIDPSDGMFFVAKKGIFNKNPKVYKSHAEIDADTSGELADKLKIAFTELRKLGIKSGVYQGDMMFTQSDLKKETVEYYANNIGKIIEYHGYSICSTNIQSEQTKSFFEPKYQKTLF